MYDIGISFTKSPISDNNVSKRKMEAENNSWKQTLA